MPSENNEVLVRNAEGEKDTKAIVVAQNKVEYQPKISVVVPVYNAEEHIKESLDSIVNQTLKEIEIICVDDGSTDNSLQILKQYAAKDNRITVLSQPNYRSGAARNAGITVAKGKYITFLDSDDFFKPDMLEKSYKKAWLTKSDITVWRAKEYNDVTKQSKELDWAVCPERFKYRDKANSVDDFGEHLFQALSFVTWNKIISSQLVNRLNIRFGGTLNTTDLSFIYSALVSAKKISLVDEPLVSYRVNNPKSLQGSKHQSWESPCQALVDFKKFLTDNGLYEQQKKSFANMALKLCLYYLQTMDGKSSSEMKKGLLSKYFKELDMQNLTAESIYNKDHYREYKKLTMEVSNPASIKKAPLIGVYEARKARI